ncbi:MAG: xanthine dehydrogenase family protein subunit M [Candidatus Latescibacterota bacterium]
MHAIDYAIPGSVKEAVALLSQGQAEVLAGGTDLLLRLKADQPTPRLVVDVKRIPGFDELRFDVRTGLAIGPAVTLAALAGDPVVQRRYPALAQGAGLVGSVQIRNRATLAGNLCNAAPSADTAPPLLVLGARMRLAGPEGRRTLALEEFFLGPGENALQPGELVVGIQVPAPRGRSGSAYARHTLREAMDLAVVGVGVALRLAPRRPVCEEIAIALGAVAPTPMRATQAEAVLEGEELTPERIAWAAGLAAAQSRPISDVRASAEYRRELVEVLTRRMLEAAVEDARRQRPTRRKAA